MKDARRGSAHLSDEKRRENGDVRGEEAAGKRPLIVRVRFDYPARPTTKGKTRIRIVGWCN